MTADQLNLLGQPDRPEDLELGVVQREVMRELRQLNYLTRDEAGAITHQHRGKHGSEERCQWCAVDGAIVIESLVKRGLVERGAEGSVQLARPKVNQPDDEIPY